jgi:hypothetical protein
LTEILGTMDSRGEEARSGWHKARRIDYIQCKSWGVSKSRILSVGVAPSSRTRRIWAPAPAPASSHTIVRPYEAETQATEEARARTLMEAVEEPTRVRVRIVGTALTTQPNPTGENKV